MILNLLRKVIPNDSEHVTIELRNVVKDSDIFDRCDPFPIWDEDHRGELEKKIIEHYYFRQIGFETVGRFKFELNTRLREIMPRYNKLYKTTLFKYNPIHNYDMEEANTSDREARGKGTRDNLDKFSETPQGELENLIEGKYLTNATHEKTSTEDETKGQEKYSGWRRGNIGVTSTQQLIEAERKIIIDLDLMIIADLKDLFIGVY